ncbi:MAG: Asp-tRNA(Asn)/Glu-tRNA(Gln) amidotransferase GatCAB subunit A, partial [Sinobacteraceae bacterium]|nr:Asp-tRNA(Asn)/Glu-tRNA(Gln) amidotransferase GatCAB subunit A [Nevskiaceae bacterium]
MHDMSIKAMSEALRARKLSSRELTQHFLVRIERLDPALNSFVTVTRERALAQADAADAKLAQAGDGASPLLGVPLAEKDIFCTEGVRTTCGSKMLDNFIAPYDATVVRKLHGEAGAVMLGKTNMDEFAMGSSNETSYYGPVKNPWDQTRVPGGSSGGSVAAVAAGLAPAATATDTGGSIRQPAALTGLTGIKPTYGRVSRYGMIAFASSLDQGGVAAHSAEDAAFVLQAMAGFDERDSTSIDRPVDDYTADLEKPLKGLRIGLPEEHFADGLDATVRAAVEAAA